MTTATVTVLFTDMVGSTALLSRLGADEADLIRQAHFADLRGAFVGRGGVEVKTLGDGLMVTFESVAAAVVAAAEMQRRVRRSNRRSAEPIGLRVGIAVGEADQEDGDWYGLPVVEAARLCAEASGGQVLCSALVPPMCGSRAGAEFVSLGTRELKGLDAPVEVFDVRWEAADDAASVPLPVRMARVPALGLIGRDPARAAISDVLKEVEASGRPRGVIIGGEAGIGKTTLVADFARHAHAHGATVLYGRCDEDVTVPYRPWTEALTQLVEHVPAETLRAHVDLRGCDVARLVPRLAERVEKPLSSMGLDPEAERYALIGAVQDLLSRVSDEAAIVVVLDDLHWADAPTIALTRHVLSPEVAARLLLIGTYRPTDIDHRHPMSGLLTDLHREEHLERLDLDGLGDRDVVELLEAAAGHELDEEGVGLAHALRRETNGNPFFTTEVLRHLAETGAIHQGDDGRWTAEFDFRASGALPASVRDVIGRRVARLGDETQRVLCLAAVIGREFDVEILAAIAEVEVDVVDEALDAAVAAGVIHEIPGRPGRYSFAHALVERTLYDELGAMRRARAHRRVAEVLESEYGDDPGDRVGELATHWMAATRPEDPTKALEYAARAGAHALAHLAPDEAQRWYGQALELHDRASSPDDRRRAMLLTGLGNAQRQLGDAAYRETLLEAAGLASGVGDVPTLVRAVLANNRGFASSSGRVDAERVEALERARLATLDAETPERAMVLATLAAEIAWGDRDRSRRLAEEAVEVADRLGDDVTFLIVQSRVGNVALRAPDNVEQRLAYARRAMAAAERLGDPVLTWHSAAHSVHAFLETASIGEVDHALEQIQELMSSIREPYMLWVTAFMMAWRTHLAGELDAAERWATEALEHGTASGQPDALAFYSGMIYAVRREQGRLDEIVELLEDAVAANPGLGVYRPALAECMVEQGRDDEARELLDEDLADGFARHPFDSLFTTSIVLWARVAAALRHEAAAAHLAERLEPWRDQVAVNGVTVEGSLADALGLVWTVLGRRREAADAFSQAATMHERLAAPLLLARTHLGRAHLLATSARPDDRALAADLAEQARRAAASLGGGSLVRRADETLAVLADR